MMSRQDRRRRGLGVIEVSPLPPNRAAKTVEAVVHLHRLAQLVNPSIRIPGNCAGVTGKRWGTSGEVGSTMPRSRPGRQRE
jgi:hypothetical protein